MFVRVRPLRRGGRRVEGIEEVTGDLRTVGGVAELQAFGSMQPGSVLRLHRADVQIAPGVGGIRVRGFEERNGAAVLQEWDVMPLERVMGHAGYEKWADK